MICIIDVVLWCDFGLVVLCIVVLGLNFYVGENGVMGYEEIDWMVVLVVWLWVEGFDLVGFLFVDMMFYFVVWVCYDVVLCVYYD